jgi:hypothetical protein
MEQPLSTVSRLYDLQLNPDKFIELVGIKPWSGMNWIMESIRDNQRTSVRACHGMSKTVTAAVAAVWFLNLYNNSIVITTAPTNRQVESLLWKEIRAIYSNPDVRLMWSMFNY